LGPKLAVSACLLALALAGCGTADREQDAAAVVERFHGALESGDGQAACRELSRQTAKKLEQQEKKPCEEAIMDVNLPKGGTTSSERVEIRSAQVRFAQGGADFLSEGPGGWRISAAGCRLTTPGQPYDCELED
jgi:hypothetical protein